MFIREGAALLGGDLRGFLPQRMVDAIVRKVRKYESAACPCAEQCFISVPGAKEAHGGVEQIGVGPGKGLPIRRLGRGADPLEDRDKVKPSDRLVIFRFRADMLDEGPKITAKTGAPWSQLRIMEIDPRQADMVDVPKIARRDPKSFE